MRSRVSVIPKLFSYWWETLERPHRLFDQHFGRGLGPEYFSAPSPYRHFPSFYRQWMDWDKEEAESGWSLVKNDRTKFHVMLDVQQFKPEEVTIKVVDNYIVVEGKHEDKEDDHGMISRHFIRKYLVPDQCDAERTTSTLSSDGILTITAPRRPEAVENKREKIIKIEQTGKPLEDEPLKIKQSQ